MDIPVPPLQVYEFLTETPKPTEPVFRRWNPDTTGLHVARYQPSSQGGEGAPATRDFCFMNFHENLTPKDLRGDSAPNTLSGLMFRYPFNPLQNHLQNGLEHKGFTYHEWLIFMGSM